jgi:integrase
VKLNATATRTLQLPRGVKDKTFWDDDLAGFGLRLRAGGSRKWLVQYAVRGDTRRLTLGSTATLAAHEARAQAQAALAQVKLGKDPARDKLAQQEAAADTFGKLLPRFLERQRLKLKPRSFEETNRHLVQHADSLHRLPITALDRRAIAALLSELADNNGPGAANRVRASLSAFCTWLARDGYLDSNPVAFTNRAVEQGARGRVLSDAEVARIWRALRSDQYAAIVKLLVLSGARRDEIGGLRWSEVNLDAAMITLPPARTKNRREHLIPLSPPALEVLTAQPHRIKADGRPRDLIFGRGQFGFRDWSGSKADLDARIAEAGEPFEWVLHDFRRSLSTALHEQFAVPPHVVEALLGHVSGHKAGVAGTYNRASYIDERRRALERWGEHLITLISGKKPAAVVTLRGSGAKVKRAASTLRTPKRP